MAYPFRGAAARPDEAANIEAALPNNTSLSRGLTQMGARKMGERALLVKSGGCPIYELYAKMYVIIE
jgi:hypothetical protein